LATGEKLGHPDRAQEARDRVMTILVESFL
jgi:hypothetical protein